MGRVFNWIKGVSPLPLAVLATAEIVNHPDEVGAAIAEAVMEIPKLAEKIGDVETAVIDVIESHGQRHHLTYEKTSMPEPEGPEI